MRIGIDARLYHESGIGRYIRNLLYELQKIDSDNQYFVFLLKKDLDAVKLTKNFTKVEADIKWYSWTEQIKLPKLLSRYKLDLVHFPHFNIPIFYNGKFIVTIHDLIHQHFSMQRATTHGPLIYQVKQLGYRFAFWNAVKRASQIITVSKYVQNDLNKTWNIPKGKVAVTYEGVEENFLKLVDQVGEKEAAAILSKYKIQAPFIFYLGNAHPHKNIEGLIKAFIILRQNYQYINLVLAGQDHYFWQRIKSTYSHPDIIYTGFIDDRQMVALYKKAVVRVIPSFEEGFGIPVLEAFACGCPVICSNTSSLPEVGGEAAYYFNPKDPEDMAEKIQRVINDSKLKKSLITKGKIRFKQFSWRKLAQETLKIYKQA